MRITVVTETFPPEINGVALTVARSVAHLRSRAHEVDVVRPCQAGEMRGAAAGGWCTPGGPLPFYPELRYGYERRRMLIERFATTRTQLVHVATEGPLGWTAVSAAQSLEIPATSDFRTNFHEYSRYYRLGWLAPAVRAYLSHFHNRTRLTFAPTEQTRRELIAMGVRQVAVAGRGVDLERFDPCRRDAGLRKRLGALDGPLLLHVGRLAAEKNVRLALQAFRAARRLLPGSRMVVVGDGPLRNQLAREFDDVSFVGSLSGDLLAAHYASADLFLFPSLTDTFGNVTLEALASGLPVVAYDLAAASEHVLDHLSGRLVAPGDEAGFVAATSALALQWHELMPLRAAARRAAEAATWPKVLDRFEAQLLDVLNADRSTTVADACAA